MSSEYPSALVEVLRQAAVGHMQNAAWKQAGSTLFYLIGLQPPRDFLLDSLCRMTLVCRRMKWYPVALKYFERIAELSQKEKPRWLCLCDVYSDWASTLLLINDRERARSMFEAAILRGCEENAPLSSMLLTYQRWAKLFEPGVGCDSALYTNHVGVLRDCKWLLDSLEMHGDGEGRVVEACCRYLCAKLSSEPVANEELHQRLDALWKKVSRKREEALRLSIGCEDEGDRDGGPLAKRVRMDPGWQDIKTKNPNVREAEVHVGRFRFTGRPSSDQEDCCRKLCFGKSVLVIENLAETYGLDTSLMGSDHLAERYGSQTLEIREQPSCPERKEKHRWVFTNMGGKMTIGEYVQYQRECLRVGHSVADDNGNIKFGTNLDIRSREIWEDVFAQLDKLPSFLGVCTKDDMLHLYPKEILGVNRPQMYLKVAGCRTPGHQENNNLCSINLSLGPGDCEWYFVDNAYWTDMERLCEANKLKYVSGSWWPDLDDLRKSGIPFCRVVQKAGETVVVNMGTIHWVGSLGVCNNIAWNFAPFLKEQYDLIKERYFYNRAERFQSVVPLAFLSCRIAEREDLLARCEFRDSLRAFLQAALAEQREEEALLSAAGVTPRPYANDEGTAKYCQACLRELVSYALWRSGQVLCVRCGLRGSGSPSRRGRALSSDVVVFSLTGGGSGSDLQTLLSKLGQL